MEKTNKKNIRIGHPLNGAPHFFLDLEETGHKCLQSIGFGKTTSFLTNSSGSTTVVDNNRDFPV